MWSKEATTASKLTQSLLRTDVKRAKTALKKIRSIKKLFLVTGVPVHKMPEEFQKLTIHNQKGRRKPWHITKCISKGHQNRNFANKEVMEQLIHWPLHLLLPKDEALSC